ncbi:hypothetical protein JL722_4179 [Aureococcus anophagefferens]|nr:hypothetical protein JL722_4179 [Aureococcus anophagefferens]
MNTDEIQGALVATLSPDVTVRRQAEAYLDNCRRTAGFPVLLLQLQLSQALTLIASTDFPGKWPNLLPEIVARFADGDAATVQGMLLTSNSILKRFRYAFKSDALYAELKYALDTLAAPLTRLFGTLGEELRAAAGDAARSAVALESLRLACRVFFSLNWQDLPEFFEDHMAPWMGAFQEFLAYEAPGAAADDEDDDEGPVERLQAAAENGAGKESNASLYAHKYEEEFQPHLPQFVSGIWQRLMKTSLFPKHDRLAATSMRFLAEVVEAIVIPNMTLRDSDVELFEDNAVEYISRDLESADSETRRRDLSSRGVSKMSDQLDILEIYSAHVAPELGGATATHGVVLADCVQFACTFRNQIPGDELLRLLPLLGGHLGHGDVVVQSYAAHCLERVLAVPGCVPGKIHRPQLAPLLPALFQALFAVIDGALAKGGDAPWENEYVMKAVMRLLVVGQADVVPHAAVVTEKLCASLGRVCANPRNPKFNHYLFESLAVLVRVCCEANRDATATFEGLLFPPFQSVLQMDVVEFAPYVFQILALLLGYRAPRSGLGTPTRRSCRRCCTRRSGSAGQRAAGGAARGVSRRGPDQILAAGQLEPMLGVFQKLLASKASEGHAFGLLKSLVVHVPQANLDGYLVAKLDAQQPGLLPQLVVHVLAPHVLGEAAAFASAVDAKAAAVGAVKLLAEAPDALTPNGDTSAWSCLGSVLFRLLKRLAGAALAGDATIDRSDDVPDELLAGYDATFSKLHFGTQKSDDAFAEIPDTQTFAMTHLTQLVATKPHFQPSSRRSSSRGMP